MYDQKNSDIPQILRELRDVKRILKETEERIQSYGRDSIPQHVLDALRLAKEGCDDLEEKVSKIKGLPKYSPTSTVIVTAASDTYKHFLKHETIVEAMRMLSDIVKWIATIIS